MKNIACILVVLSILVIGQNEDLFKGLRAFHQLQREYERHLKILGSAVHQHPDEDIFICCSPSIEFIEQMSGIKRFAAGTTQEKKWFSKEDFVRWANWYEREIMWKN